MTGRLNPETVSEFYSCFFVKCCFFFVYLVHVWFWLSRFTFHHSPDYFFELRHAVPQTRRLTTLISGGASTPAWVYP